MQGVGFVSKSRFRVICPECSGVYHKWFDAEKSKSHEIHLNTFFIFYRNRSLVTLEVGCFDGKRFFVIFPVLGISSGLLIERVKRIFQIYKYPISKQFYHGH